MEAKQIAQQDAERAKFIVEKVSGPEAAGTATDGRIGGTGAAGGGDSGGGRGGGGVDDLTCTGEGWGCIRDATEDRGEQGDCPVAVAKRERDVGASEQRKWRPAQFAGQQVDSPMYYPTLSGFLLNSHLV